MVYVGANMGGLGGRPILGAAVALASLATAGLAPFFLSPPSSLGAGVGAPVATLSKSVCVCVIV